ncbi:hypothetical protein FHW67_001240 [Herbaspirillum sp. Sphag1AN]|nr:hypothetical protein [Herbaspirillum sp. Sphag1AN]MBB3244194.1 hypothetical protein [Herbaspirillum sp. Sphag64]
MERMPRQRSNPETNYNASKPALISVNEYQLAPKKIA